MYIKQNMFDNNIYRFYTFSVVKRCGEPVLLCRLKKKKWNKYVTNISWLFSSRVWFCTTTLCGGEKCFFLNHMLFTQNQFPRGDRSRTPDSVIRQPSVLRQLMNRVWRYIRYNLTVAVRLYRIIYMCRPGAYVWCVRPPCRRRVN